MDRVACCRRAAREAVADIEPPRLHDAIVDTIDRASMTPAALTLESGAAVAPDADLEDTVVPRAAAVQLIYEGLYLTRELAHAEPWGERDGRPTDDAAPGAASLADVDADLAILAADILVARGFYLLARTEAADMAVDAVRAFGRHQTRRHEPGADAEALDAELERDVLELGVRVGAESAGEEPDPDLLAFADDVVDRVGTDIPPAAQCLASLEVTSPEHAPGDGVATDRATSASDH